MPENEYSMMSLARLMGMNVPAIELIDVGSIAGLPQDVESMNGQALAIERFDGFDEEELTHLAGRVGLPKALVLDTARETVELFHQYWSAEKKSLPLSADVVATIDRHLRTVPIA